MAFKWTKSKERAAEMLAEDRLSDVAIANKVGVAPMSLYYWKRNPEFRDRIEYYLEGIRAAALKEGIAHASERMRHIANRHAALRDIVRARRESGQVPAEAGGETGLVIRQAKIVKVYDVKVTERPPKPSEGEPEDPSKAVDEAEGHDPEDDEIIIPTKRVEMVYEYTLDTGLLAELDRLEADAAKEMGHRVARHAVLTKPAPLSNLENLTDAELEVLDDLTAKLEGLTDECGGEGATSPA